MKPTVPVIGKLQPGGRAEMIKGSAMTAYSYTVVLDGVEAPPIPMEHPSRDAAIAYGRALLHDAVAGEQPDAAYCAVFAELGDDAEALGAWDYQRGGDGIAWAPEE